MLFEEAPPAPTIVVVGQHSAASDAPNSRASVDVDTLRDTTNLRNSEDSLRYLPSLLVRKRHAGDTQAPLATRTSGVGASARSLVYADGVLLSALIGNNNSFASPRWGMIAPEEIDHVDVLYGPFSAAYPGNAIGAVVNIATRLPDRLEASATAAANLQRFDQYGTKGSYPLTQIGATIGDRIGRFAFFASASHLDGKSQPLAYVTTPRGTAPAGATATPATGAFADVNRLAQPIWVLGAGGFEHQLQDIVKLKLAVDLSAGTRLTYLGGLFVNDTASYAETYLTGAGGPLYSGSLRLDGTAVTIPASSFASQVYTLNERHWMHALTIERQGHRFSWTAVGSLYDYARDVQRSPSLALPTAATGGAGSIVRMDGTGWRTLDLHARWRPGGGHAIHAGLHYDRFTLVNDRFASADWRSGGEGALTQSARGRTRTMALWAQDAWDMTPRLMLTVGARREWWRAYDGLNFSATPALAVRQPQLKSAGWSPKAALRWQVGGRWSVSAAAAKALRFPTVSELYQAVTTGNALTVPNPALRPENARSFELAAERSDARGRIRLSLFDETIRDALVSQTAPLVAGSTQLFSYVQNIGRTRTRGAELAFERRGLLPGFDLSGSVTLADPKIASDPAFPAAEGKLIPQVPRRRATLVATWRPARPLALTAAVRASSRMYATINNADTIGHTYQGFEGFVVGDLRAAVTFSPHWRAAIGVENVTDRRYFLFHPFPGRTFTAEVGWTL